MNTCSEILPRSTSDKNYFLQFMPCVDQGSRRKIIFGATNQTAKIAGLVGSPTIDWNNRDSKELESELENLLHSMVQNPWLYTGEPVKEPSWCMGVRYTQTWERKAVHRGRLVATVPLGLYPATRKISVKTWETRTRKTTSTDQLESSRTTEIIGNERLSVAAQKQILSEQSATYKPSATVNNVTIPVKGMSSVGAGGQLGISGAIGDLDRDAITRGRDFIVEATVNAVESIKSARTVVVEDESTVGFESTSAEELSNPNRTNTLTYLYYELEEEYRVSVEPTSLDLYLQIPLTV